LGRLADGLERVPHKPELFWANYWLSILQPGSGPLGAGGISC
jgi:hypothetical protein